MPEQHRCAGRRAMPIERRRVSRAWAALEQLRHPGEPALDRGAIEAVAPIGWLHDPRAVTVGRVEHNQNG